ncbi:MAG: sulfatase-like hydrolase/transferase [Halioglobus sp.]
MPTLSNFKGSLVALFLPFLICISLPLGIYLGNQEEIGSPLSYIAPYLGTVFLVMAAFFVVPLLLPSKKFKRVYLGVLVALSLIVWVQSNFLFGDYGLFNGEALDINDRSVFAFMDAIVCLLLIYCAIRYDKLWILLGDLVVGIFILTLAMDCYAVLSFKRNSEWNAIYSSLSMEELDQAAFDEVTQFSSNGNIIHILLDELQSDVFERVLSSDSTLAEALDGFTYFPNTSGVYPYTEMSLPAILSGEIYKNDASKSEYLSRTINRNTFITSLNEAGYKPMFHIHPAFCSHNFQLPCSRVPGISTGPAALNLIDLALFRSAPAMLKKPAYNGGMGLFKQYLSDLGHMTSQSGIGYLLLQQFNERFSVADIPPTYKFYQTMATHAPLVMESDCTPAKEHKPLEMRHMKVQANCALQQVTRILEQLKSAGIYDQTLIILSSDHGGNYLAPAQAKNLQRKGIPEKHFARAKSTLLIKPFNAHGELQRSKNRASLADIAATTLAQIGSTAEFGEDLFAQGFDRHRLREFYFIKWGFGGKKGERLEGFTPYTIKGDVRSAKAWHKKKAADEVSKN